MSDTEEDQDEDGVYQFGWLERPIHINFPPPTGAHVLVQFFADDTTLQNNHSVHIKFPSKSKSQILYKRDENIVRGGVNAYEGIFLLKIIGLNPKKPAFTAVLKGADTVPQPSGDADSKPMSAVGYYHGSIVDDQGNITDTGPFLKLAYTADIVMNDFGGFSVNGPTWTSGIHYFGPLNDETSFPFDVALDARKGKKITLHQPFICSAWTFPFTGVRVDPSNKYFPIKPGNDPASNEGGDNDLTGDGSADGDAQVGGFWYDIDLFEINSVGQDRLGHGLRDRQYPFNVSKRPYLKADPKGKENRIVMVLPMRFKYSVGEYRASQKKKKQPERVFKPGPATPPPISGVWNNLKKPPPKIDGDAPA